MSPMGVSAAGLCLGLLLAAVAVQPAERLQAQFPRAAKVRVDPQLAGQSVYHFLRKLPPDRRVLIFDRELAMERQHREIERSCRVLEILGAAPDLAGTPLVVPGETQDFPPARRGDGPEQLGWVHFLQHFISLVITKLIVKS